jgi:hypothetical protein
MKLASHYYWITAVIILVQHLLGGFTAVASAFQIPFTGQAQRYVSCFQSTRVCMCVLVQHFSLGCVHGSHSKCCGKSISIVYASHSPVALPRLLLTTHSRSRSISDSETLVISNVHIPGSFRFSNAIMDAQQPRKESSPPVITTTKVAKPVAITYNDFSDYENQLRQFGQGE